MNYGHLTSLTPSLASTSIDELQSAYVPNVIPELRLPLQTQRAAAASFTTTTTSVDPLEQYNQSTAQQFAFAAASAKARVSPFSSANYPYVTANDRQLWQQERENDAFQLPPPPPLRWTGESYSPIASHYAYYDATCSKHTFEHIPPPQRSTIAPVQYASGSSASCCGPQSSFQETQMPFPRPSVPVSTAALSQESTASRAIEGSDGEKRSKPSGRQRRSSGRRHERNGTRVSISSSCATGRPLMTPDSATSLHTSMMQSDFGAEATATRVMALTSDASKRLSAEDEEAGDHQRPGRKKGFAGRRPDGSRHNEPLNPTALSLMDQWFAAHADDPFPSEEDKQRFTHDGVLFCSLHFVCCTVCTVVLYRREREKDKCFANWVCERNHVQIF